MLIAALFFTSSTISSFGFISRPLMPRDYGVRDTISFLKQNGLSYGYGPYWGAYANSVTAASARGSNSRPVTFDKGNGKMAWTRAITSKRWYTSKDVPEGVNEYFVIVNSDGEECPDVEVCLSGLSRQFGPPNRTLQHDQFDSRIGSTIKSTILVWNHRLMPPISLSLEPSCWAKEGTDESNWQWCPEKGKWEISNDSAAPKRLALHMTISMGGGQAAAVQIVTPSGPTEVWVAHDNTPVLLEVTAPPGMTSLPFSSAGTPLRLSSDPRPMAFRINNLHMTDLAVIRP